MDEQLLGARAHVAAAVEIDLERRYKGTVALCVVIKRRPEHVASECDEVLGAVRVEEEPQHAQLVDRNRLILAVEPSQQLDALLRLAVREDECRRALRRAADSDRQPHAWGELLDA